MREKQRSHGVYRESNRTHMMQCEEIRTCWILGREVRRGTGGWVEEQTRERQAKNLVCLKPTRKLVT